jgi:hypothetical protein
MLSRATLSLALTTLPTNLAASSAHATGDGGSIATGVTYMMEVETPIGTGVWGSDPGVTIAFLSESPILLVAVGFQAIALRVVLSGLKRRIRCNTCCGTQSSS